MYVIKYVMQSCWFDPAYLAQGHVAGVDGALEEGSLVEVDA
jgi:hypothetical protein